MHTPIKTPQTTFLNRRKTLEIDHHDLRLGRREIVSIIKETVVAVYREPQDIYYNMPLVIALSFDRTIILNYQPDSMLDARDAAYTALCEIFDGETF